MIIRTVILNGTKWNEESFKVIVEILPSSE
ncbi:hypothetical protein J2786_002297 [Chryseobacterium vietnamense]|jgi:hypothetical protein|uniref:Uncharacterized protein n=1 Tax=Chryseobacterium vietnamense TaxID=866785 RepID=A0ACC6J8P9_9FLAO|nr:hypothetical protein [Chryseobacterium vietnamense]MDR6487758.1 hypothetical protein [Chryseobacterium vietnamense]